MITVLIIGDRNVWCYEPCISTAFQFQWGFEITTWMKHFVAILYTDKITYRQPNLYASSPINCHSIKMPIRIWLQIFTHWGRDKMAAISRRHFQMHFPESTCKISITISLKFVAKGPVNYIAALVQIMAWHRPADKPLSEPMMVSLLTHICVTRPQWVKSIYQPICTNDSDNDSRNRTEDSCPLGYFDIKGFDKAHLWRHLKTRLYSLPWWKFFHGS